MKKFHLQAYDPETEKYIRDFDFSNLVDFVTICEEKKLSIELDFPSTVQESCRESFTKGVRNETLIQLTKEELILILQKLIDETLTIREVELITDRADDFIFARDYQEEKSSLF